MPFPGPGAPGLWKYPPGAVGGADFFIDSQRITAINIIIRHAWLTH